MKNRSAFIAAKTAAVPCLLALLALGGTVVAVQLPARGEGTGTPDAEQSFGPADARRFAVPPASFRPETWFHFIGANVSTQGITADLEAIAGAGISGVQLFHGQFGGKWPGTGEPITCMHGKNQLTIEVTSTWHNRLVHDAGLAEDERKTWTIEGPKKEASLSRSGLLGPVVIRTGEGPLLSNPLDIGSGRNIRTGKNDFVPDASPEDQP